MNNRRVADIKRAQKTSLLYRTISKLFLELSLDKSEFRSVFVNRVEISPDKGMCYVYFCALNGLEEFEEKLPLLTLYKPSLRAALAKEIRGRYTPDLLFKFDSSAEKARRIEDLLYGLQEKGDL